MAFGSKTDSAAVHANDEAEESSDGVKVVFAECITCPAEKDEGLCSHVFTLLITIEYYGPHAKENQPLPGEESATSCCQSWGPRNQDVEPAPGVAVTIEQTLLDDERKKKASSCNSTSTEPEGLSFRLPWKKT